MLPSPQPVVIFDAASLATCAVYQVSPGTSLKPDRAFGQLVGAREERGRLGAAHIVVRTEHGEIPTARGNPQIGHTLDERAHGSCSAATSSNLVVVTASGS